MANANGLTEIIVSVGGRPVRLATPKQWRRAIRQGQIERHTIITREYRYDAAAEEAATSEMRADACEELQPLLDDILGPAPIVKPEPVIEVVPAASSEVLPAPSISEPASTAKTTPQPQAQPAVRKAQPMEAGAAPASKVKPYPAPDPKGSQTVLRWIFMVPGAALGSFLVWRLLSAILGFLTFDFFLFEAVAAYALGFLAIFVYMQIGMAIAPVKSKGAKWGTLLPYLLLYWPWAILFLLASLAGETGPFTHYEMAASLFSFSDLSSSWQVLWYVIGLVLGGFYVMRSPPSEFV